MDPMHLREIEGAPKPGPLGMQIEQMRTQGSLIPQIWHLFAFKPHMTHFLAEFTQQVMRGPSPLSPGMRELIAAFTSRQNQCLF